jgi:hypothetical protein
MYLGNKMVLGIDEVGRGAWAGPLVVGACVLNGAKIKGLTDSKALSKKQREKLSAEISKSSAIIGLGWVSNDELDEIGLSAALKLATRRAVKEVQIKCKKQNIKFNEIIIDGTINFLAGTPLEKYASTLKKADLLISSVSAAAICAKVARDNFMAELSKKPELAPFCFENHAGYGTPKHRAALSEFGVSKIHRKSFKPIAEFLENSQNKNMNTFKVKKAEKITTKELGDKAEDFVAEFLKQEKHEILARNWRTKFCEIDIVSKYGENYYFTEVKFRKNNDFGGGEAAISKNKVDQMRFAVEFFAYKNKLKNREMRLAAAIVEGENFKKFDWFEITD